MNISLLTEILKKFLRTLEKFIFYEDSNNGLKINVADFTFIGAYLNLFNFH